MSLTTLPAHELIQKLDEFDSVIDARSENEFFEDHLPGAVNWPTLNNDERRDIGTLYKQVNAFEAGPVTVECSQPNYLEASALSDSTKTELLADLLP